MAIAVKSVIDVEVQAAAFEAYQKLFDAYNEKLRKQPDIWKQIQGEHAKLAQGFANLGSATEKHLDAVRDLEDVGDDQEKHLKRSGSLWSDIEKSSGTTAKHVSSMTTSMLKWTGLLSGASALLGYFSLSGLDRLGTDVYGFRKSAMGLGVSSGQERAFGISFGPMLSNPGGFLDAVSAMASNPALSGPLAALSVNPNQPIATVATDTLRALSRISMEYPSNQLGIPEQTYPLAKMGIGVEDLRRIQTMTKSGEFNQLLGFYGKQQGALGLSDASQRAWTRFILGMDAAKASIENVFVRGLVPLTGPIERLAGGFSHLLGVVMAKGGPISKDIDAVAAWMDKFNGQIAKPAFLVNVENFTRDVGAVSAAFASFAKAAGITTTHAGAAAGPARVAAKAAHGLGGQGLADLGAKVIGKKFSIPAALFEASQGKYAKAGELFASSLSWPVAGAFMANEWLGNEAPWLNSWGALDEKLKSPSAQIRALDLTPWGSLGPLPQMPMAPGSLSSNSDIMAAVKYLVAELKVFLSRTPSVDIKNAPGNTTVQMSYLGATR